MDPNFDRLRRRFERTPMNRSFHSFRSRLYRSANGKVLGVFSGLAESMGYSVCMVRWGGVLTLLFIASSAGAHGLKVMALVAGFFYLLLALLMQPPRGTVSGEAGDVSTPPPMPMPARSNRPAAVPYPDAQRYGPRPDLAALDRQLDNLNRRIQRMETIVTDRQYDWERRLGS